MLHTPYFVGTLSIGDYAFFSGNRLCPILVERKSVQDVAQSIHDGRWQKQKQRMYRGQYLFGYETSRIAFLIEGKAEAQQVTGGYIGHRRFDVDMTRFDEEIQNLKSEGFEVLRTHTWRDSMKVLSEWACKVGSDVNEGKLPLKYTYEEFLQELKKIPESTDFSRLAKDAMASRMEQEQEGSGGTSSVPETKATRSPSTKNSPSIGKDRQRHPLFLPKQKKKDASATKYDKLTKAELQEKCTEFGLTTSGNKAELINRLCGPRPPKVWLERKKRGQKVPKTYDTCNTALLVGLYLKEKDAPPNYDGMTKEELYTLAESLDISKDPFSGRGDGPFHYDGWSGMNSCLLTGDPALVVLNRRKYKLTRSSSIAGYALAEALHTWCHEHGKCKCAEVL